jgi:hypothetical protein
MGNGILTDGAMRPSSTLRRLNRKGGHDARLPEKTSLTWYRSGLEPVVHTDLADVRCELHVSVEAAGRGAAGCLAEIDVEIFDLS